jgi:hypothetical protein
MLDPAGCCPAHQVTAVLRDRTHPAGGRIQQVGSVRGGVCLARPCPPYRSTKATRSGIRAAAAARSTCAAASVPLAPPPITATTATWPVCPLGDAHHQSIRYYQSN